MATPEMPPFETVHGIVHRADVHWVDDDAGYIRFQPPVFFSEDTLTDIELTADLGLRRVAHRATVPATESHVGGTILEICLEDNTIPEEDRIETGHAAARYLLDIVDATISDDAFRNL